MGQMDKDRWEDGEGDRSRKCEKRKGDNVVWEARGKQEDEEGSKQTGQVGEKEQDVVRERVK